tara:strand:+ start:2194 stop:2538 length:345 start_codon:yes stop_codon:yes gene_type:complete
MFNFMRLCPACSIAVEASWDICPKCSQALSARAIEQAGGVKSKDPNFATNLGWYYHTIPFITAITAAIAGDAAVQSSGALVKTIFPPLCLVFGGFVGLIILKEISEMGRNKDSD